VRADLHVGGEFPELRLPDHTRTERSLSELARGKPLVLCFVRGWWCPKEQVRLRGLVGMQAEVAREYGRLAVVTVDEPYVNGAFRAGLGADFPFLSDVDREVATGLDLLELTDDGHRPFLPLTFVLGSTRRIHGLWCGFWYWGNPTPDELRLTLREITRQEQPTFDPQAVWASAGAAPAAAGVAGEVVVVKEDREGREFLRAPHRGPIPAVGSTVAHSDVDGRPWVVDRIDREPGRTAIHLRRSSERPRRSHRCATT